MLYIKRYIVITTEVYKLEQTCSHSLLCTSKLGWSKILGEDAKVKNIHFLIYRYINIGILIHTKWKIHSNLIFFFIIYCCITSATPLLHS